MKIGVMLRQMGELGGIGMYTRNLLSALFDIDHENEYVLFYRRSAQLGLIEHRGAKVSDVLVSAPGKLWWDQVAIPRAAERQGVDVLFNPKLTIPLFARCKTVLVMHGAEQMAVPECFRWYDRAYFMIANPLYCRRADAIISPTRRGASDIVRLMRADPGKIHIIPHSYNERCRVLPASELEGFRARHGLPSRYVLFVGGLVPLKNFSNLLRALALLRRDEDIDLVVVGFERWRYRADLRRVQQLGLVANVHFAGYVSDEDLPGFYNLAELFVLPSLYEGFGIPVVEAMACGCPVVSTRSGCTPEVAGDAAILTDPRSPTDIADGMLRVLRDERLRARLIQDGLARANDFSWKRCGEQTLDLFHSLTA